MKMLSLTWVHAQSRGYKNVGYRELIVALSLAPHESLFDTELIITLIEHFWAYYFNRVFWACFVPYIIYFVTTILYVSAWGVEGIREEDRDEFTDTAEFIMRWIILISVIYFAFFEFVAIIRDGWSYTTDIFNYFDWSAILLNFYVIIFTVWNPMGKYKQNNGENCSSILFNCSQTNENTGAEDGTSEEIIEDNVSYEARRSLAALLIFVMWVKTFYWMSLFGPTSFYVRLIQETIYDIRHFLVLFLFILMTFGNTLLIMNQGRNEEE